MKREIAYDQEALLAIKQGVDKLADAVKVTLGPKGRNVAFEKHNKAQITKDGVSVAREIILKERLETMGSDLIMQVSSKSEDKTGDGTTTTVVLAQAMLAEGARAVTAGIDPNAISYGIDKAVAQVVRSIKGSAQRILEEDDFIRVATISANGDEEIGNIVGSSLYKVGEAGIVTVEDGQSFGITAAFTEGMQLEKGYVSPYFSPNGQAIELNNPAILLYKDKLTDSRELFNTLEQIVIGGNKEILIIAKDFDKEVLMNLINNNVKGTIKAIAVKMPTYNKNKLDLLEDIAVLTAKIEDYSDFHIGSAQKVKITREQTVIINGNGDKQEIQKRARQLQSELQYTKSAFDREKILARLSKLTGGVAVIEIGAATETEQKEKKDRVEDALYATRAAIEEGIVAGGGTAFINAIQSLEQIKPENEEELVGIKIVRKALEAPFNQILKNAGIEAATYISEVKNGIGYDAKEGRLVNMIVEGIIDPAKVTIEALINAASTVKLILTIGATITFSS